MKDESRLESLDMCALSAGDILAYCYLHTTSKDLQFVRCFQAPSVYTSYRMSRR